MKVSASFSVESQWHYAHAAQMSLCGTLPPGKLTQGSVTRIFMAVGHVALILVTISFFNILSIIFILCV